MPDLLSFSLFSTLVIFVMFLLVGVGGGLFPLPSLLARAGMGMIFWNLRIYVAMLAFDDLSNLFMVTTVRGGGYVFALPINGKIRPIQADFCKRMVNRIGGGLLCGRSHQAGLLLPKRRTSRKGGQRTPVQSQTVPWRSSGATGIVWWNHPGELVRESPGSGRAGCRSHGRLRQH
jgi:hypothetical protein